uniref:Uncharacterized protein n=1 Tax=Meloidogyne incognita TaxID=6306 RepID=A0A914KMG7_MELIC
MPILKIFILFAIIITIFQLIFAVNLTSGAANLLPIVPLCLLRCKDNHMLTMDSEWSSDFVFPLAGMLRSDDSREYIIKRVKSICEQNMEMFNCLQKCPESNENEILQMGVKPWEGICNNLRVLETQIGCWKRNIEVITQECGFESQQLHHSTERLTHNVSVILVSLICEHLRHLSVCLVNKYGKYCGAVSQRIIGNLFDSSRETMSKMLRIKWESNLPKECIPNDL